MLTIKRLDAKGCRGILDGPPLNFGVGGLLLCGGNGVGKSSYVDGLEKVLTGRCSSLDTGDQGLSWGKQGTHLESEHPEITITLTDGNTDTSLSLNSPFPSTEPQYSRLRPGG